MGKVFSGYHMDNKEFKRIQEHIINDVVASGISMESSEFWKAIESQKSDEYIHNKYGLKCYQGFFYEIVDEQKFTKYLLKYG